MSNYVFLRPMANGEAYPTGIIDTDTHEILRDGESILEVMQFLKQTAAPSGWRDVREAFIKIGHAPGDYFVNCRDCGKSFLGDKRARICFDCACNKLSAPPKEV
jgi:hypothetical protein